MDRGRELLSEYLFKYEEYYPGQIMHYCPACKEAHQFAVTIPFRNNAQWTFNGDVNKPTFSPSMNITVGPYKHREEQIIERCHYFLTDGVIQFLDDCTHELKGQSVPLPILPDRFRNQLKGNSDEQSNKED